MSTHTTDKNPRKAVPASGGPGRTCARIAISLIMPLFLIAGSAFAAPERKALLIGINEYASPKVVDLRGAVNDVTMLRRILITRFGFEEQDITVLTDEQATRSKILSTIDDFVDDLDADDSVYIHYSGHGSRIKDLNGDEDDEFDETILPHNARMPGIPDIIDDELERRFAKIDSANVFIVFDSCYAGTITRSASAVQPRATLPDTRTELYRDIATRAVIEVESLPHVLMTGAPADKQALDGPVDEGFFGLFSYSLARSLDTNGPDATPEDVHRVVKQELQRIREQLYTSPPEPQLEAPENRLRSPILPIAAAPQAKAKHIPRRTWLGVRNYGKNQLRLVDGIELNARPGSQWGIYGAGEERFEYGNALAFGTVEKVIRNDSILNVSFKRGPIPADARAIALAPPDPAVVIPLRFSGISDDRTQKLLARMQNKLPSVRLAADGEFARFIAELNDGSWRLLDAGGLQQIISTPDADDAGVAAILTQVLARSASAIALLSLDNPASAIDLRISVGGGNDSYRIRASGAPRTVSNSLMLGIRSDRDVYVTVVDVDTEGNINVLFPNDYQDPDFLPNGLIRANRPTRIPDTLSAGNRAGFHWDFSPPAGKDTIRVFAATNLETAATIRNFIRDAGAKTADLAALRTELNTRAVRGVRVVADTPADDWAAASLTIDLNDIKTEQAPGAEQ